MQLFYLSNINSCKLSGDEFIHCIKVLRKKINDLINITDGKGNIFSAKINGIDKNTCSINIISNIKKLKKDKNLHIVIAPTKSFNRMEWMVEKLTEIGVREISFIYSKNSERKKIKLDRLEKKAISAMKQCNSAFKPIINDIVSFNDFIKKKLDYKEKFIAQIKAKKLLKNSLNDLKKSILIIGPEGDFNDNEIKIAQSMDFDLVSLGNNVLRTETAAIVSCSTIIYF